MKKQMKELNKKSPKELETTLKEKRGALRNFRFQTSGSNAKNVKAGLALRKDIARILTLLNNKK